MTTSERPVCPKCEKPRMTPEEWDRLDDRAASCALAAGGEPPPFVYEAYRNHCLCVDGGAVGPA